MITDAQLTLASQQAVTASAASANQIDLTHARNLERSGARSLRLVALVTTAFATLTSLKVGIRQSATANMASPDVLVEGPVVAAAALIKGAKLLDVPWPSTDPFGAKQFIDAYFTVAGASATAGAVWVGVVMDSEGGELRLGNVGR